MDNKAKTLFENNPKLKALYKVKGEPIYFTKKDGADDHVKDSEKEYETINRPVSEAEQQAKDEAEAKAKADAEQKAKEEAAAKAELEAAIAALPDGDPTEAWTIPQIQTWLTAREVKFASNAKEANLLGKVTEYLEANKAK
ncbi:hypothetical protein [Reichenbachiella sp.]|uniref:hypothetical protein n=1 Tax=Reichenbachiella sp. TaxID=2184521 RepID=UPI003B58BA81